MWLSIRSLDPRVGGVCVVCHPFHAAPKQWLSLNLVSSLVPSLHSRSTKTVVGTKPGVLTGSLLAMLYPVTVQPNAFSRQAGRLVHQTRHQFKSPAESSVGGCTMMMMMQEGTYPSMP